MKFGITLIGAIMLVCIALMPIASANSPIDINYCLSNNESEFIDIGQVNETAQNFARDIASHIDDLSEWKTAAVKQSAIYYDLNGKKSAYAYDVIANNQYAGYIMVSATTYKRPVLEFSKGKRPDSITDHISRFNKAAEEYANLKGYKIGTPKLLYTGATFYYKEYPLIGNTEKIVGKVIIDSTTADIVNLEKSQTINSVEDFKSIDTSLKAMEERIQSDETSTPALRSGGESWISGVPAYLWREGCSPTSAAMILGYWEDNGYSGLPTGNTLIDELADAMGTLGSGGTPMSQIPTGIKDVCDDYQYSNFDSANDYYVTWAATTSEILAGRPFVLSIFDSLEYTAHSVACIGYFYYTDYYVYIYDTYDTNVHYVAFGEWDRAHSTWVRP